MSLLFFPLHFLIQFTWEPLFILQNYSLISDLRNLHSSIFPNITQRRSITANPSASLSYLEWASCILSFMHVHSFFPTNASYKIHKTAYRNQTTMNIYGWWVTGDTFQSLPFRKAFTAGCLTMSSRMSTRILTVQTLNPKEKLLHTTYKTKQNILSRSLSSCSVLIISANLSAGWRSQGCWTSLLMI